MSEKNRIRFAGLMEEYLNIPIFVCELIEKQLEDNKYKEVIEYVVQRRNEIENKEDYLSEQEKIKQYLDLQQKVEQLENIRKEAIDYVYKHIQEYDVDGTFTNLDEFDFIASPQVLLNILNKGSEE